ncbi:alpha-amylase family glycosyl hydrolase [Cystobacter fuscus]
MDGFRLDTVKHVDHAFWREHRRRTREELGKDFFLLGEVWGGDRESLDPWFSGDELDAGFDFGFQGSALAWVQGRGRTVAFDAYLRSRHKVRKGYLLSHFLSSHDVPGALFQLAGDKARFRLAALLQLTTTGMPVIYYGEEVGRPGGDWPANRGDMPWGERRVGPGAGLPRDESLRQFYQKLVALRRAHPALSRGSHQGLATEGDVYTFVRHDPESGDAVVVAVNRGGKKAPSRSPGPRRGVARPRETCSTEADWRRVRPWRSPSRRCLPASWVEPREVRAVLAGRGAPPSGPSEESLNVRCGFQECGQALRRRVRHRGVEPRHPGP